MMRVNVVKRVETLKGDRYCSVVVGNSGHIQPDWVIVNGNQEKHAEGSYYLEWREKGRRKRHSVGKDAIVAFDSKIRKLKELEARAVGLEVRFPEDKTNHLQLRPAITEFLEEIKLSRQKDTWEGYKVAFDYFLESCRKQYLDDVQRIDVISFRTFLSEKKKLAGRTIRNKLFCLKTFFNVQGVSNLFRKHDMPRYVRKEVEIFEGNQLIDLYRVCDLRDQVLYDFLLMTGFRDQEARYVTWDDVRFETKVVQVRSKPRFGWSPKNDKEREVPVPEQLLESLRFYRKSLPPRHSTSEALIFGTSSGKPDLHMLRGLKRNAERAGLRPKDFRLHKFRATFATTHLRAGVELETVMTWMGQTALESISRYLKPATPEEMFDIVNRSFTGPTFANRRRMIDESME